MEGLRPCPFCGGHATSYGTRKMESGGSTHCLIHCDECSARLSAETEAEAVAAWNRRAERTCLVVRTGEPSPTGVTRERRCSECGGRLTRFGAYCHGCGARIEEDE